MILQKWFYSNMMICYPTNISSYYQCWNCLLLSFCFQCLIKCEYEVILISLCFYVSGEERPDETDTLLEVEVEESNIFPDTLATETTPATVPTTITTTTTPSIATTTTRRTIYREERPAPTVTLELDNTSNNSYIAGTVDFKTILW